MTGQAWTLPTKNSSIGCYLPLVSISLHKIKNIHAFLPDIDDQRILQSDWMREFWPTTYKAEFSQVWDLQRKTDNCKFFQFRIFPAKNNDEILWKLKKTPFWAHFRGNKNFFTKSASVIFFCFLISVTVQNFRVK